MKNRFVALFMGLFVLFFAPEAFALELRAGIVYDSSLTSFSELIDAVNAELKELLSPDEHISFAILPPKSSAADINASITHFERDKDIDAIIAFGAAASHVLASRQAFIKPSIAAHIIDPLLQGLRVKNKKSTIDNFGFVSLDIDYVQHINVFSEITEFSKLHLVANSVLLDCVPKLVSKLKEVARQQKAELIIVKAQSLKQVIKDLDKAQAVYLLPLGNFSSAEQKKLVNEINKMKIPTMSMRESAPKEYGVFISLSDKISTQRLARRLAIDLRRLIRGENPKNFQTDFPKSTRLAVNMETARQIGVYPTWAQMTDAIIINEENRKKEKTISISTAIETALVQNLKILAKRQELKTSEHEVNRARAEFQPQLSLYTRHTLIDSDRAQIIFTPSQNTTVLGSELKMLLNSEKAKMGVDAKKFMQAAKQQEERALVLDITKEAIVSYINVLKAKALQTIRRDDLEVTRTNLEIARFREQVGLSSPAEAIRWQTQMANSREALIAAAAARKKAEIALNHLLNAPQEEEFDTVEKDIYSSAFFSDYNLLAPFIDNVNSFKYFRDFMVADTFAFSPEIKQMNKMLELAQRRLRSIKRGNKRPTVAIIGGISERYHRAGKGSDDFDTSALSALPPLAPLGSAFEAPDNTDWNLSLNISVPLYDGADKGLRKTEQKQLESEISRLKTELESLASRLEMRTRASLEDARVSFFNILLSKERADCAGNALKIVQNAYSQGTLSITDLIDAQNTFLVAREASANAVFNFIADFAAVSRAVGSFDFMLCPDTSLSWQSRLHEYFKRFNVKLIKRKQAGKNKIGAASGIENGRE